VVCVGVDSSWLKMDMLMRWLNVLGLCSACSTTSSPSFSSLVSELSHFPQCFLEPSEGYYLDFALVEG